LIEEKTDMKSFLAGLGIGVGIGLLFAPLSGEETRGRLQQRASDLADSARDIGGRVQDTVSRLKERAQDIRTKRPTGTEPVRDL
jgi:gas vesicle protein